MTEPSSFADDVPDPGQTLDAGTYVYCIIHLDRPRDFPVAGVGGSRVFTVQHDTLAAVVSDTAGMAGGTTRENVLAHELVNETVMRDFTVIPMSFGTVFPSADDVLELLRSASQAFTDVLGKMQDKIEFGVKVRWDREKVLATIEQQHDEILRLRDEITRNAASSTYFARMQLGRLVDAALEEAGKRFVADVHDALAQAAVASRSNKVIDHGMILNGAFLVERTRERAFEEQVRMVSRRYQDVLTFKYTGPWPPYNFVNIRLRLEKASTVPTVGIEPLPVEARIVVASIDTYLTYSEVVGGTWPVPGSRDR